MATTRSWSCQDTARGLLEERKHVLPSPGDTTVSYYGYPHAARVFGQAEETHIGLPGSAGGSGCDGRSCYPSRTSHPHPRPKRPLPSSTHSPPSPHFKSPYQPN